MDATSDEIRCRYTSLRYRGSVEDACSAHGDNPFCGDELTVTVRTGAGEQGTAFVERARFNGYGCSLCLASADVLMECIEGMSVEDARAFSVEDLKRAWGGLEVGRSREACVALSVDVLHEALKGA